MSNLIVERTISIAAPQATVWETITAPEKIVQWMVPNLPGAQMKRDDNGNIAVYLGEMGVDFMVQETLEPPQRVTIRSLPERLITVTYQLTEEDGHIQVTVTMSGFEALPATSREDRMLLSGTGWERALKNLNAYIGGADLPFPQAYVGPLFGYWRAPEERLAIERSIWIDAPRTRVWQALTDPKQYQAWYSPNTPWELSALEVGGRYYVYDTENEIETHVGIIDVLDAPSQFVTRTLPEPPEMVVKDTAYTLTEENGGTRLILTLTGYEPEPEATRWHRMEENAFGFGMMLQNTKTYVEGNPLPFPWGF
jgi:uncharacterized protein YndB with AHSA1/START domain